VSRGDCAELAPAGPEVSGSDPSAERHLRNPGGDPPRERVRFFAQVTWHDRVSQRRRACAWSMISPAGSTRPSTRAST
jgi:hypothetical protein